MQAATVEAVFTGQPRTINDQRGTWTSSIFRTRNSGPVSIALTGLQDDAVAQPYHGGPDAAVCVHLASHYRFWNTRYGLDFEAGSVGENVTLDGLEEDDVCVGDRATLGTALVEVSGPRVPCANLARRIGRPDFVRPTVMENRSGFYLRVLRPGTVQQGDRWSLQQRQNPAGTIPAINRCMYLAFDPAFAQRMLAMDGLALWWKEQAQAKLSTGEAHWTSGMKTS